MMNLEDHSNQHDTPSFSATLFWVFNVVTHRLIKIGHFFFEVLCAISSSPHKLQLMISYLHQLIHWTEPHVCSSLGDLISHQL